MTFVTIIINATSSYLHIDDHSHCCHHHRDRHNKIIDDEDDDDGGGDDDDGQDDRSDLQAHMLTHVAGGGA